MPSTFKRVKLASTCDHVKDNDRVKKWVEHAGGKYTGDEVTSETTHLLCSKTAWQRYHEIVRQARRTKRIKIVNFAWLKDSLILNKGRPLPTAAYEWDQRKLRKPRIGAGQNTESDRSNAAQPLSLEDAVWSFNSVLRRKEAILESEGYTLFSDENNFTYSLALARPDAAEAIQRFNVRRPSEDASELPIPTIALPTCLHPSPLPLHLVPPNGLPIPFILNPQPSHLRNCNIPDPDPAVFAMQMYVSDENPPRFCIINVIADQDGRAVAHESLPQGTVAGLAMEMWRKIFLGRTGLEWGPKPRELDDTNGKWAWNGHQVLWTLLDGEGNQVGDTGDHKKKATGQPAPKALWNSAIIEAMCPSSEEGAATAKPPPTPITPLHRNTISKSRPAPTQRAPIRPSRQAGHSKGRHT